MIVGTAVPTIFLGTIVPTMIAGTKNSLAAVPTTLAETAVSTIIVGTTVPTMIAGTEILCWLFYQQYFLQMLLEDNNSLKIAQITIPCQSFF